MSEEEKMPVVYPEHVLEKDTIYESRVFYCNGRAIDCRIEYLEDGTQKEIYLVYGERMLRLVKNAPPIPVQYAFAITEDNLAEAFRKFDKYAEAALEDAVVKAQEIIRKQIEAQQNRIIPASDAPPPDNIVKNMGNLRRV